MVIGVIGESCSGKTVLAKEIQSRFGGEIITGRDYLRLAKSESAARMLFLKKLHDAVFGDNVIYVIADREHLSLLPEEAIRIVVSADLDVIKARFKLRLHGQLPEPVAKMLASSHGIFDSEMCDFRFKSDVDDPGELCDRIEAIFK